jgi:hypothetical protein
MQIVQTVLVNEHLDEIFLHVFISCLYMFRAASAHHQEGQIVLIHHLVQHNLLGDSLTCRSARQAVTHQSDVLPDDVLPDVYQMMY